MPTGAVPLPLLPWLGGLRVPVRPPHPMCSWGLWVGAGGRQAGEELRCVWQFHMAGN